MKRARRLARLVYPCRRVYTITTVQFIQFVLLRIPIRGDTLDRTFFFSLINNMPLTLTVTRDSEGFIQSHAYA